MDNDEGESNPYDVEEQHLQLVYMPKIGRIWNCPYCHQYSQQHWAFLKKGIHPVTYEKLANRGWIRCGDNFYKVRFDRNCCKQWTRRINVQKFEIKSSQVREVKRMMKLLKDEGKVSNLIDMLSEKIDSRLQALKKIDYQQALKKANIIIKEENKSEEQKSQPTQKMQQKPQNFLIPQKKETEVVENEEKVEEGIEDKEVVGEEETKMMEKVIVSPSPEQQIFIEDYLREIADKVFKKHLSEQIYCMFEEEIIIRQNWVKQIRIEGYKNNAFGCNFMQILWGDNKAHRKNHIKARDFYILMGKQIVQMNQKEDRKAEIKIKSSGFIVFAFQQLKTTSIMKQIREKKEDKVQEEGKYKKHKKQTKQKKQGEFQFVIQDLFIKFGFLEIEVVPVGLQEDQWRLYQDYNVRVHQKRTETRENYSWFLCTPAIQYLKHSKTISEPKIFRPCWDPESKLVKPMQMKGKVCKNMGCYHMKYYLRAGGKQLLIAVGVVDILPQGLQSAYFFYNPDFMFEDFGYRVSWGVFSALMQIEYTRWLGLSFEEFKYYNMGTYIQNHPKMKYKGNYGPFELLCPITYRFVSFTPQLKQLIEKIQKKEVASCRIAGSEAKIDCNMCFEDENRQFYVIQHTKLIPPQGKEISEYAQNNAIQLLTDYCRAFGKDIFQKLAFTF